MTRLRRSLFVRGFAFALMVWLAADALSHGTCTHDLITFAREGLSLVRDTSAAHPRTTDRGDVNHCSCHWQYLPAVSALTVHFDLLAAVAPLPAAPVPPFIERNVERPPQRLA